MDFEETIHYTKQLIKVYIKSECYQELELMEFMKRLIFSQIQCKQFENAMKTFDKMKLYKLNSMDSNDVKGCLDLKVFDDAKFGKNPRFQEEKFQKFYAVVDLVLLKSLVLCRLGDKHRGDEWSDLAMELCGYPFPLRELFGLRRNGLQFRLEMVRKLVSTFLKIIESARCHR